MNQCKGCYFYRANVMGEQKEVRGYCFHNIPVVLLMPISVATPKVKSRFAAPDDGQGMQLHPASVRPLVLETDFCSHFRPITANG